MSECRVPKDDLRSPGQVVLPDHPCFPDAVVTRIRSESCPQGALPTSTRGEYLVAFSRRCTHMGAHLVSDLQHGCIVSSIAEEGVLRCPCHLSCFDLLAEGLVVIGQATANLAQIELVDDGDSVRLSRWMSFPYAEIDL